MTQRDLEALAVPVQTFPDRKPVLKKLPAKERPPENPTSRIVRAALWAGVMAGAIPALTMLSLESRHRSGELKLATHLYNQSLNANISDQRGWVKGERAEEIRVREGEREPETVK